MGIFEDTEQSYIEEVIEDRVEKPRLGDVKKVIEHTGEDDGSNFECDVITAGDQQHLRAIPVAVPSTGMVNVPRVGDTVIVTRLAGRGDRSVIIGTVHTRTKRAPLGEEGVIRYNRGSVYFEIDGEGDTIRLAHKNNDDDSGSEANVAIEIDSTGATPIVNVKADTINLGDPEGDLKPVARVDDSVEVSDPDSGTLSGTITSGSSNVEST